MRIQRIVARAVKGLLRMRHSSMRLNTIDEEKAITTRSSIGMSDTAITQEKHIEAMRKPLREARSQVLRGLHLMFYISSSKASHHFPASHFYYFPS